MVVYMNLMYFEEIYFHYKCLLAIINFDFVSPASGHTLFTVGSAAASTHNNRPRWVWNTGVLLISTISRYFQNTVLFLPISPISITTNPTA